ncbi:MAG: hypothetical protein PHR35_02690 [Kiritimatiellae bacterium]|nr:hypothetical protein [Kiritimatiellia bacterium]
MWSATVAYLAFIGCGSARAEEAKPVDADGTAWFQESIDKANKM